MGRPGRDVELVQIVDASLADAARRSGDWLICRAGCTPCCHGPFTISALDQARLQAGLDALTAAEPQRASRLRSRIAAEVARIGASFPGDPATGAISSEDDFALFAETEDEPCPVLSPETGTCDLYEYRPMTCRVFGPPVESEDGLGHCELCFVGAPHAAIAAAQMHQPWAELEEELTAEAEREPGSTSSTIVELALRGR